MKKKYLEKDLYESKVSTLEGREPKLLKLQTDQVRLSDGQLSLREFVHHPGAALVIPEIKKGHLLFIKQFRYAMQGVYLELPAGKIDKGEDVRQTAKRELREEAGYVAKKMRFVTTIHPVIGYGNEVIHIFLAQGLEFVGASPDEGEFLIPQTLTLKQAMAKIRRHKITDVKTQIAIFWYEKIYKGLW